MTADLAKALVAAQGDMPKVEPDSVNPHFRSKFVSLDHLIAKTRPVLNRHGLAIVQSPTHIDGAPALATTIHHASGESVTHTMPLILGGSDMQKLGAALTYARRYAWAAALGISEQEDDDGNTASAPAPAAVKEKPPGKTKEPFTAPSTTEPRTDEQAAELTQLATELQHAGQLTPEQFLTAARKLGADATLVTDAIGLLTVDGAANLLGRLKRLRTNQQKAA